MRAPLSTMAPMPISARAPIVQPCRITLWPITQSGPMVIGKPRSVCSVAIVLNLRALAELDPFVVAAQHGAEPDAAIGLQPHLADDRRARRDPIAALPASPASVRRVRRSCETLDCAMRCRSSPQEQAPGVLNWTTACAGMSGNPYQTLSSA
jgi:hypothetical protein